MCVFSIVIPTRNRPDLLARALASVKRQQFLDYEVIVVDDGSDIALPDIGSLARVVTLAHRHGPGGARNAGIKHARGRYIAFLDDDDEYCPTFLSDTYSLLNGSSEIIGLSCASAEVISAQSDGVVSVKLDYRAPPNASEGQLIADLSKIGTGFGVTFKAECLRAIGGFDESFTITEDTDLFYSALAAGYRPAMLGSIGVIIHAHAGERLSANAHLAERIDECGRLLSKHAEFLSLYPFLEENLRNHIKNLKARMRRTDPGSQFKWSEAGFPAIVTI